MSTAVETLRRNLARTLREGRLEEASGLLDRLRRLDPLALPTRGLELEYLLVARRTEEAEALARELMDLYPTSARIFFLAGRVAYARRRYEEALERFAEAGRLAPHWRVRYWTGKTLTQLGRLDEAEPILEEVTRERPFTAPALAWLHERRGDVERAIAVLEVHVASRPEDTWAARRLEELRARRMDPERLSQEVEDLLELGDEISPELLAGYVDSLLATGRSREAREAVARAGNTLDRRSALRIAWACHRGGLPDLACALFLRHLPEETANVKLLTALEKDARLSGRLDELMDAYRELAAVEPRLWGRLRRLLARIEDTG